MTASILLQLLTLYFAIIYSWPLSSSGKSLVWKKNSSIYFKNFTDIDLFHTDVFFISFVCFTESLFCLFIYLRTTDRHFCDQGNIRHSTSKLLKYDFIGGAFRTVKQCVHRKYPTISIFSKIVFPV